MFKKIFCLGLNLIFTTSVLAGSVGNFGTIDGYEFKLPEYTGKPAEDISLLEISIDPEKVPSACPLEGVKYAKILEEIKRVSESYNTNCISRAENIISNINSGITAGEQLQSQYALTNDEIASLDSEDNDNDEDTVDTEDNTDDSTDLDDDSDDSDSFSTSEISPSQAKAIQSGMDQLSKVISDKQCRNEFQERGIMPILQRTIQSVSNIALLVPNSQSIAIGLSGSLINTTIDVFREMLKPKFQWDKDEDRKTFLRFNCAYTNVKKLIEKEGIYEIYDQKLTNKIKRKKEEIAHLNKLIKDQLPIHYRFILNERERKKALKAAKKKRKTEVITYIFKDDKFTPFENMQSYFSDIIKELKRLEKAKEEHFFAAFTRSLTRVQNQILYLNKHIENQGPHENLFFYGPMFEKVTGIIKKLNPKDKEAVTALLKLQKADIPQLIMELLDAKEFHKTIHQESYKVAISLVTPEKVQQIIAKVESDQSINNKYDRERNYIRDTNSSAYAKEAVVMGNIDKALLEKEKELATLEGQYRPAGEKSFTLHNEASNDKKTIADLDKLNQDRIYGPTGYGLIRWTVKESEHAIKIYNTNIERLLEEMPEQEYEKIIKKEDKILYCNNIREMKEVFAHSHFPIELAYDFSVFNLPLIHNLYEKHFILEDERYEMRAQVFSALYAKALIDKYNDPDDLQIDTVYDLKIAANALEYEEKAKVCSYKKQAGHHKNNNHKFKKVCRDEKRKALPEGSIGREMIKLTEIKEKALELQRSFNSYCLKKKKS